MPGSRDVRSSGIYVTAVQTLIVTQAKYCELLQSYLEEWEENGFPEEDTKLIHSFSTYWRCMQKFLQSAQQNLSAVREHGEVWKLLTCTFFNKYVTANPNFVKVVPILLHRDGQLAKCQYTKASLTERKILELFNNSILALQKGLARLNLVIVKRNQLEVHETTMALMKLCRILESPGDTVDEEDVSDPFETKIDRAHDTSLLCLTFGKNRGIHPAKKYTQMGFDATKTKLKLLQDAVRVVRECVDGLAIKKLSLALLWFQSLGQNPYDYAVRSFLEKSQKQHRVCAFTGTKLGQLQKVLGDAVTALENLEKDGNVSAPIGSVSDLVEIVTRILCCVLHDWFQCLAEGHTFSADKRRQNFRDIVVDYFMSINFTNTTCQRDGTKLFRLEMPTDKLS